MPSKKDTKPKKKNTKSKDLKLEDEKVKNKSIAEAVDKYLEESKEVFLQNIQPLHTLQFKSKKRPENEKLIKSFYQWRGIKMHICTNLGICRPTLDKWIREDKELSDAYQDALEASIDHAESKLMELIDGVLIQDYDFQGKPMVYKRPPDIKALNTFLMCKGKNRGYVAKAEVEHSGNKDNPLVSVNYIVPSVAPALDSIKQITDNDG